MTPQEALSNAACVACLSRGEQQAIQTLAAMATIANPGGGGGGGGGDMLAANNLSDVADVPTSRTNLGLGSLAVLGAAPAGTLTGATLAANVLASSLTSVGTLSSLTVTAPITGSVTGAAGSTTGNAATATALQTARAINGVNFDGTAAITITAAAGTLTGATLASGVTASSLTSVGSLSALTVTGALSAASVSITGTAGAGFLGFVAQSSAPSAPAGGYRQYADATGRLSWIRQSDGFTRTFDATLTANRVYTLPDATVTLAQITQAQTFAGIQTFSGPLTGNGVLVKNTSASGNSTAGYVIRAGIPGINNDGVSVEQGTTGSTFLFIDNAGKTGISTTAPDRALEVNSATGINLRLTYNDSNGSASTYADFLVSSGGILSIVPTSGNLKQGAADAAVAVPQIRSVQSVIAGTSNTAGANRTDDCSQGTGTGTGGAWIVRTAPAGSTGSAQNALVTALTITGEGNTTLAVAKMLTFAAGTNQRSGNATLVGGTVTVSNTTVTANTLVHLTRKTSGGTIGMAVNYTLSAATSFTITSDNILDTSVYTYLLTESV